MVNYCSIGKLVATFGVGGEMVLRHSLGKKTALKGLEAVFVEKQKDELLPYFIESAKAKTDTEIYLKLEGIGSREAARTLLQKQVWLEEASFQQYAGRSAPIALLGYHIVEGEKDLGEILEVIEQPHQLICRLLIDGKEALIPLHEQTLLKVDKKKKQVQVRLPEGLLDVFR